MKKLKILHIEADTEFLGAMYGAHFEKEGFEYIGYKPKHPVDLIKLVLKEQPDLILMDILMPVIDGFAAIKIIKGDPRTKDIPICFLTNLAQDEHVKRAIELGATDYLIMANFTPKEIVDNVKKILMRRKIKIMIFEDEKMLSAMYVTKFENIGFQCRALEHPPKDAAKLIDLILEYQPDLIIMSVIMPIMDGFQATEIIKSDKRTKDIRLIFLTSCGQEEDIDRAKKLGALKYLIKAKNTPSEVLEEVYDTLGIKLKENNEIKPKFQEPNYHRPSFFDLPINQHSPSSTDGTGQKKCLCDNSSCAKCLLVNCTNESCSVHTKKYKEEFQKRYKDR